MCTVWETVLNYTILFTCFYEALLIHLISSESFITATKLDPTKLGWLFCHSVAEVGLDAMLHYESGSSKLLDDTLNYALLSLKQTWKWHPHLCTFNFADYKLCNHTFLLNYEKSPFCAKISVGALMRVWRELRKSCKQRDVCIIALLGALSLVFRAKERLLEV